MSCAFPVGRGRSSPGVAADEPNKSIYADLDTECLRNYWSLFTQHNITLSQSSELANLPRADDAIRASTVPSPTPTPRTAFLARMGTDNTKKHSIPNAWMASMPAHPFWLLPLNIVASGQKPYGDWPEAVTGPDALFHMVNKYAREYSSDNTNHHDASLKLDRYLRNSALKDIYLRSFDLKNPITDEDEEARKHRMILLNNELIFPYWWGDRKLEIVCRAGVSSFDPETCKDVLDVRALGSWSVTYWSHSWSKGGGHDQEQLGAMKSWVGGALVSRSRGRGRRERR